MYDLDRELIDALKSTGETLKGLLSQVSVAQAKSAKGGDENWSVVEVICHLRDAEEISLQRMQTMRDQDRPKITGYDQEALARERNYNETNLYAALNAFIVFRERRIAALSALSSEEWERSGEHNEFGRITIFAHTLHKVSHDAIHCAQIARQLLTAKAVD
jgi:hypothetical protein